MHRGTGRVIPTDRNCFISRRKDMSNQSPEASSMDQVRDLLMGTQLKDMEARLHRQEQGLLREIANLRDNIQNRMDSLENSMKSESATFFHRLQEEKAERTTALKNERKERTESLKAEQKERADAFKIEQKERGEALKAEQKERGEGLARLSRELAAKEEDIERKLTALSTTLDTAEQELRQLMRSENARLSQTIAEKYKEALSALSTTAAQIRHDVVARSSLSAMFAEAAVRFSAQGLHEEKEVPRENGAVDEP